MGSGFGVGVRMSMEILNVNEATSCNFLTQSLKRKAKSHSVKFKALNFKLWFSALNFTLFAILVSLCFLNCPAAQAAEQIIIDHTSVDLYDKIPAYYMNQAKKMWINIPGESHSSGYRKGISFLMQQNPAYNAVVTEEGSLPEPYREDALRISQAVRNIYSKWTYGTGESVWYANPADTQIKLHLDYSNTNNLKIDAIGFGWCWDMTWQPSGWINIKNEEDPVYHVHWNGSSVGGPQGNTRWGLDADDYALTGNTVCMDTYLNATQAYADYVKAKGYKTKVLFTTGPADGSAGSENGFQRHLKHEHIRNFVKRDPDRILFDYADILCYNNSGQQYTSVWTRGSEFGALSGTKETVPSIHPDNAKDFNGSWALRLGKALWVLAARLAGWEPNIYYVTPTGAGSMNGVSWDNAYAGLPAQLKRGSTYYIASGSYSPYEFKTPLSGELYVTLKKATAQDHGVDIGWNDSYAQGQAVFTGGNAIRIYYGYFIMDGQTGGGPGTWSTGHGFKLKSTTGGARTFDLCGSDGWYTGVLPTHVSLLHAEIEHRGRDQETDDDLIYAAYFGPEGPRAASDVLISYCYLHDCSRNPVLTLKCDNWTFEYNYVTRNCSSDAVHSEGWQDFGSNNVIIRYNIWEDIEGTCVIALKKNYPTPNENWDVYGNVFADTPSFWATRQDGVAMGVFGVSSETLAETNNIKFYNNTMINLTGGNSGLYFTAGHNIVARNNIWYDCWDRRPLPDYNRGNVVISTDLVDSDYNTFIHSGSGSLKLANWTEGAHDILIQNYTSSVFADWTNKDFRITAGTAALGAGVALDAPYNNDWIGILRGADGVWDRGALEYTGGSLFYGDISGDSALSAYDAALCARIAVGLDAYPTGDNLTKADVSGDGFVTAYDAALIAQRAVGLISKFPVES